MAPIYVCAQFLCILIRTCIYDDELLILCSGGQETLELQRELGANLEVDVAYQYLTYFLEDDEELADIGRRYKYVYIHVYVPFIFMISLGPVKC